MADGTVVLPPRDRFAGLRGFSENLIQGLIQQARNQQLAQQVGQIFPGMNLQGITDPRALQLALQQQQPAEPFTLGPGQQRFGPTGRPIAQVPIAPKQGTFQQIADPVTGQQINALVDPVTGDIIKKFGTIEAGLTAKDKVQVAVTQAKEFRADPRIKNLQIVERSERGMQAALKQATSPNVKSRIASDQALGVLFQKMLDPTSVVRESEFARTPEGAAAVNRLLAIAPQLRLGGLRLLDEDRRALVTMAQKLLDEAKITANKAFDEFETRADEIGLNKKIIFGGAKRFDITGTKGLGIQTAPTKANIYQDAIGRARSQLPPNATNQQILDLAENIILGVGPKKALPTRQRRPGFLGREESEFPLGFPPGRVR